MVVEQIEGRSEIQAHAFRPDDFQIDGAAGQMGRRRGRIGRRAVTSGFAGDGLVVGSGPLRARALKRVAKHRALHRDGPVALDDLQAQTIGQTLRGLADHRGDAAAQQMHARKLENRMSGR